MTLREFMQSRLPEAVVLPDVLSDLFDWIDSNGWIVTGHDGDPYGCLAPGAMWDHDGTSVSFHIEAGEARASYSESWLGVQGHHDVLVPFARTGADGSEAAFWVAPDGFQRIVHLGSGSGSVLTCVLAEEPIDFLRLLAIGYDEICWLDDPAFADPPVRDDGFSTLNEPFQAWVRGRGVEIPSTAREIVPNPARMDDSTSPDLFCSWLNEVTRLTTQECFALANVVRDPDSRTRRGPARSASSCTLVSTFT